MKTQFFYTRRFARVKSMFHKQNLARRTVLINFTLLFLSFNTNIFAQFERSEAPFVGKEMRVESKTLLSSDLHVLLGVNGFSNDAIIQRDEVNNANQKINSILFNPKGQVGIRVRTQNLGAAASNLQRLGFIETGRHAGYGLIEGFIDVDKLMLLDDANFGISSARPMYRAKNNVGAVTSQADKQLQSDRLRLMNPQINGAGINIGTLSDSYDDLGGAAAGVASGDLPAGVVVIEDFGFGGTDEGRGMMELIHDIAPGSNQFFATAFFGQLGFADNIRALANAGCQVIVDDVGYFAEPFFQDGVIAQAVDEVANNNNVCYFSSAGNSANEAYEDTNPTFSIDPNTGLMAYDFDPGPGQDFYQEYILDGTMTISLQWDDPFFTANGVDTDLDIYFTTPDGSTFFFGATDDNIFTQEPVEILSGSTGGPFPVGLFIHLFSGPPPSRIKFANFGNSWDPQEHEKPSGTITGHPSAEGAIAVAAVPFFDMNPESFTSHGPNPILFNADGSAKASVEVRQTPDIACTDAANTTFFGGQIPDGDNFPNFFGTSAAAPHAAAVAALVKQQYSGIANEDVLQKMIDSAKDIAPSGYDNITGHGLINAYKIFYPTQTTTPSTAITFEDGFLDASWETISQNNGRICVTMEENPCEEETHLILDTWGIGFGGPVPSLNEAILKIDVTDIAEVQLSFEEKEYDEEDDPMSETFSGSENSDGVAYSFNGVDWTRLVSLTGDNSTSSCQSFDFEIIVPTSTSATASRVKQRNNNSPTELFIKFQQFCDEDRPNDGIAFDNIRIERIAPPIPTMSQWGLMIFGLLMLNLGVVFLYRQEEILAGI